MTSRLVKPSTYLRYDLDLTALSTLAASGNGSFTIDGKTWTVRNFANSTSMGLLNGTGFKIVHKNVSTSYPATAPAISIPLQNLLGSGWKRQNRRTRVWAYFGHNCASPDELVRMFYENPASTNITGIGRGFVSTTDSWRSFGTNDTVNLTDNVMVWDLVGDGTHISRTGVYSSGFPALDALNDLNFTNVAGRTAWGSSAAILFAWAAQATNTNGTLVTSLKALRLESW